VTTPAVETTIGSLTTFHGTDIASARNLLQGSPLSAVKAAARKIDGPPGFFLATEVEDAVFFALRRAPGEVVALRLACQAVETLQAAGAIRRRIPPGKTIQFLGDNVLTGVCEMGYVYALAPHYCCNNNVLSNGDVPWQRPLCCPGSNRMALFPV
jgi:hypothetical protein